MINIIQGVDLSKKGRGGNHNFNIGNSSIMLYYYTICMPVNGAIQDVL